MVLQPIDFTLQTIDFIAGMVDIVNGTLRTAATAAASSSSTAAGGLRLRLRFRFRFRFRFATGTSPWPSGWPFWRRLLIGGLPGAPELSTCLQLPVAVKYCQCS